MCFFGVGCFFLSILVNWLANFFLFAVLAKAAKQVRFQHHVLILPVLFGCNAVRARSSDEPRSRPWTDAI
jgi:hypothetical protein